MPICSVVIKCLNATDTIREALESLSRQRAAGDWEVVLADNGSIDGTKEIFLEWARLNPQIPTRFVDASVQRGRAHALNAGIRAAVGDCLLFLDADDTVEPGYVAAMARALESHDFVAARIDIRSLNDTWLADLRPSLQDRELPLVRHKPFCAHAGGATLGFRRRVFDATGDFDPALEALEDGDFCIRAYLAGFELAFVPDAVYNYRFRSDPYSIYRQSYEYSRARAQLRRRYATPTSRLALKAWLELSHAIFRLWLAQAKRAMTGRTRTREQEARYQRAYGKAMGDLTGAIAFGVAPLPRRGSTEPEPTRPTPSQNQLLRR